jgi:putative oxidoreductase
VHLANGPWNSKGGYEYNLVLIAALLGLVAGGPGSLSADRVLGIDKAGLGWAVAALGAGALASAAAVELARRHAPAEEGAEAAADEELATASS